MNDPALPASLAAEVRELRRRLAALERAARMPHTSMRGGSFRLLREDTGGVLFQFGATVDGNSTPVYGVAGYDADGVTVSAWNQATRGRVYPNEQAQWIQPALVTVATTAWTKVAGVRLFGLDNDALLADAPVITDPATTAEVRIFDEFTGAATAAVTVPANANGRAYFRWRHPFTVGWGDPLDAGTVGFSAFLAWQVRRTTGTGNVYAYPPEGLLVTSSSYITPAPQTNGGGTFA